MKKPWVAFCDGSAIYLGKLKNNRFKSRECLVSDKLTLHLLLKNYLKMESKDDIFIHGYKTRSMIKDFIKYFKFIKAAGGLVRNQEKEYLFIKRFDTWDLPKGKLKKKEDSDSGAIREITEETAVHDLELRDKLPSTFHIYPLKKRIILKRTYWYFFDAGYKGETIPQTDEGITEVRWLNPVEAREAISGSYRSLSDTLLPFIID